MDPHQPPHHPLPFVKPAFDAVNTSFNQNPQLFQQQPLQDENQDSGSDLSYYCPRTPYSLLLPHPISPPPPPPPNSLPRTAQPLVSLAVCLFAREIRPRLTELAHGKGDCRKKTLYFPYFAPTDYFGLFPWATSDRTGRYFTAIANNQAAVNYLFQNNHGNKQLAKVFQNGRYARVHFLEFNFDLVTEKLTLVVKYKVFERNGDEVPWNQTHRHELEVLPGLELFRRINNANAGQDE